MSELLNLQLVFEQEYKRVKAEAIQFIYQNLCIDNGEILEEKIMATRKLIQSQKKAIMYGVKADGSEDVDNFTHSIIHRYYEHIGKYIDKNIFYYIKNYLEVIKAEFKDEIQVYPQNYVLSPEGIVKLIAKDNALMLVQANLYALKNIKIETVDDCIEKLKNDFQYEEIQHNSTKIQNLPSRMAGKGSLNEIPQPNANLDSPQKLEPQINLEQSEVNVEEKKHVNPYPIIFKNFAAFSLFLELKELTVQKKTVVADYSFIYHKMKSKTLKAINSVVTEPVFIAFLNENFHAEILDNKLPHRNPDNKRVLYEFVLNKYIEGILE